MLLFPLGQTTRNCCTCNKHASWINFGQLRLFHDSVKAHWAWGLEEHQIELSFLHVWWGNLGVWLSVFCLLEVFCGLVNLGVLCWKSDPAWQEWLSKFLLNFVFRLEAWTLQTWMRFNLFSYLESANTDASGSVSHRWRTGKNNASQRYFESCRSLIYFVAHFRNS